MRQKSLNASTAVLEFIQDYFRSTEFMFTNDSQVQIISGKDEALDAWISANYIENNFNTVFYSFKLFKIQ